MQVQGQRTVGVLQGFTYHSKVKANAVWRKGGKETTSSSPSTSSFLTTSIEPIRISDKDASCCFGIDINESYFQILSCCKRFLRLVGIKFDFNPQSNLSIFQKLGELIDYFSEKIEHLGLKYVVSKKDMFGNDVNVLESIVYRPGTEMDNVVMILYCSPVFYLSPSGSQLYKRYMKFVSDSTCIPFGCSDYGENFYLDCIVNMSDDYLNEYLDENEKRFKNELNKYQKGGEYWKLFNEIDNLPKESVAVLRDDMKSYLQVCPPDEKSLFQVMLNGIDIIKDANINWFNFNPYNDGLPNEHGRYDDDSYSSAVLASAILFSENDGVSDSLLDYVNSDADCGLTFTGWNIHQRLSPKIDKKIVNEFIRCKDLVADLDGWLTDFYVESTKFDLYGKSEQDVK